MKKYEICAYQRRRKNHAVDYDRSKRFFWGHMNAGEIMIWRYSHMKDESIAFGKFIRLWGKL